MNQYTPRMEQRYAAVIGALEGGLVTASQISAATGVSVRSVYRYVERLKDVGYQIKGAAGAGYLLISKREDALYG